MEQTEFLNLLQSAYSQEGPSQESLNALHQMREENKLQYLFLCAQTFLANISPTITILCASQLNSVLSGGRFVTNLKITQLWQEFQQTYNIHDQLKAGLVEAMLSDQFNQDLTIQSLISIIIAFDLDQKSADYFVSIADLIISGNLDEKTTIAVLHTISNIFEHNFKTISALKDPNIVIDHINAILERISKRDDFKNLFTDAFKLISSIVRARTTRRFLNNENFHQLCSYYFLCITPEEENPSIIQSCLEAFTFYFIFNIKAISENEELRNDLFKIIGGHLVSENPYSVKYSLKFFRKVIQHCLRQSASEINQLVTPYLGDLVEPVLNHINGLSDDDGVIEFRSVDDNSISSEAYKTLCVFTKLNFNIIFECKDSFFEMIRDGEDWRVYVAGLLGLTALFTKSVYSNQSIDENALILLRVEVLNGLIAIDASNSNAIMRFLNCEIPRLRTIACYLLSKAIKRCAIALSKDQSQIIQEMIVQGQQTDDKWMQISSAQILTAFGSIYNSKMTPESNPLGNIVEPVTERYCYFLQTYADDIPTLEIISKAFFTLLLNLPFSFRDYKHSLIDQFFNLLSQVPPEGFDHIAADIIEVIGVLINDSTGIETEHMLAFWDIIFPYFERAMTEGEWHFTEMSDKALGLLAFLIDSREDVAQQKLGQLPVEIVTHLPVYLPSASCEFAFIFIETVFMNFPQVYAQQIPVVIEKLIAIAVDNIGQPPLRYLYRALGQVVAADYTNVYAYYGEVLLTMAKQISELNVNLFDPRQARNMRDLYDGVLYLNSRLIIMYALNEPLNKIDRKMMTVLFAPAKDMPFDYVDYYYALAVKDFVQYILSAISKFKTDNSGQRIQPKINNHFNASSYFMKVLALLDHMAVNNQTIRKQIFVIKNEIMRV